MIPGNQVFLPFKVDHECCCMLYYESLASWYVKTKNKATKEDTGTSKNSHVCMYVCMFTTAANQSTNHPKYQLVSFKLYK